MLWRARVALEAAHNLHTPIFRAPSPRHLGSSSPTILPNPNRLTSIQSIRITAGSLSQCATQGDLATLRRCLSKNTCSPRKKKKRNDSGARPLGSLRFPRASALPASDPRGPQYPEPSVRGQGRGTSILHTFHDDDPISLFPSEIYLPAPLPPSQSLPPTQAPAQAATFFPRPAPIPSGKPPMPPNGGLSAMFKGALPVPHMPPPPALPGLPLGPLDGAAAQAPRGVRHSFVLSFSL